MECRRNRGQKGRRKVGREGRREGGKEGGREEWNSKEVNVHKQEIQFYQVQ